MSFDNVGGRDSIDVSTQYHPPKFLYTVVIASSAEAFVRQVRCVDQQEAMDRVLDHYDKEQRAQFGDKGRVTRVDKPVLIKDLTNTWVTTFDNKDGFALASVIKTEEAE